MTRLQLGCFLFAFSIAACGESASPAPEDTGAEAYDVSPVFDAAIEASEDAAEEVVDAPTDDTFTEVQPGSDVDNDDAATDTLVESDATTTDVTPPCLPTTCEALGAECGVVPDGCVGELNCGSCAENESCTDDLECACEPWCIDEVCGEKDGCEGTCLIGSGCCTHECDVEGTLSCDGASVMTCSQSADNACLEQVASETCAEGAICLEGACCTPTCDDTNCGEDDGCGGVCGGACCEPACGGKLCGAADGCGGTCLDGSGCCSPDCVDKACGESDGCGGTCDQQCCDDDCTAGQTQCSGTALMLCGDYDADPCQEWSAPQPCAAGSCEGGVCVEEPAGNCVDPVAVISGPGGSGNGVCDATNVLTNDGQVAELWSGTDNTFDFLGVPVSACTIVDFGLTCTPDEICVEFWAGDSGCSGDDCGGQCELCKGAGKTGIDVFAHTENSTLNYVYQYSSYADETSNPGKTFCYKPNNDPLRYVMVCRADCGPSSWNAQVDHVWLQ
ncbi:MAG: hypothetical protein ACPGU1_13200 [Myxococcota bacterium]